MSDICAKYRPETWDQVFGHEAIVQSVKSILNAGVVHSFLLSGPTGCGKTTIARLIAKHLGAPTREIDAATHTGIDAMRNVTETLMYKFMSDTLVIIIDEAQALSKQAWQSLLKSVEEPPDGIYWVFCTTEPSKIPDTIGSRCASYELKPLSQDVLEDLLVTVCKSEGIDADPDVIGVVAERSNGLPRSALTNLMRCVGCSSIEEAATLLQIAEGSTEIIDLCRLLATQRLNTTWPKLMSVVKGLAGFEAESVRLVVQAYFAKCALGAKDTESALFFVEVLDAFSTPFLQGQGLAPVLVALGRVMLAA